MSPSMVLPKPEVPKLHQESAGWLLLPRGSGNAEVDGAQN